MMERVYWSASTVKKYVTIDDSIMMIDSGIVRYASQNIAVKAKQIEMLVTRTVTK